MGNFGRRIQRKQGQALGQLGQATKQLTDLNAYLKELPEVAQRLKETSEVLEAVIQDQEALNKEHEFLLFLIQKTTGLTPEQESQYRAEWEQRGT